jgi:hypothetical protein
MTSSAAGIGRSSALEHVARVHERAVVREILDDISVRPEAHARVLARDLVARQMQIAARVASERDRDRGRVLATPDVAEDAAVLFVLNEDRDGHAHWNAGG